MNLVAIQTLNAQEKFAKYGRGARADRFVVGGVYEFAEASSNVSWFGGAPEIGTLYTCVEVNGSVGEFEEQETGEPYFTSAPGCFKWVGQY